METTKIIQKVLLCGIISDVSIFALCFILKQTLQASSGCGSTFSSNFPHFLLLLPPSRFLFLTLELHLGVSCSLPGLLKLLTSSIPALTRSRLLTNPALFASPTGSSSLKPSRAFGFFVSLLFSWRHHVTAGQPHYSGISAVFLITHTVVGSGERTCNGS